MELNFEKNDNKTDETDDSSLSFFLSVLTAIDIRVYIARILKKRNIVILIGVPLLMFSICAVSVKMFIVNDWTARCTLFRKTKDTHLKKDMPEIYSPIDVDTVLKTIKSRKNLINVIKTLGLKIPVISLSKQIEVTKHKNKQIITITVTNKDKEKASLIANTLSKVFLESYVKLQNSSAMEIYNYYNKSSISIQNEINTLEQKVQQYLTANKVIAIDDETSSKLEQLNELELKLLENQMRKSNLTVRLKHINEELIGMEDKVPLTYLIASGGKELAGKERTLAVLRQKYTDKNPKVIRLMSEIKELREEEKKRKTGEPVAEQITYGDNIVKQNLIVEKSNIKSQLLSLKSNIVDIQRSIDYLNKKLSKLSKVKTIKSQLQKKIEMNQNLLQK
ncbi:MAG: hypothetical protein GY756_05740, partial [bacterium]|nr:hypothetical protein [bacterium]